ncbi:MAG: TetR/AcrR family transcriptional regulator [Pseudomonadota bacterium]
MARTRGSDGKETQARIFAAAKTLFAERGFGAVGMRDVADAVGIRVGGLYRYVPDKDGLLSAITDAHMAARRAACQAPSGAPLQDLDAFLDAQYAVLCEDAEGAAVVARDRVWLNVAPRARLDRIEAEIVEHITNILSEGHKSVFQLPDAQAGARAILAVLATFAQPSGEISRLGADRAKRISANFARRIVKA